MLKKVVHLTAHVRWVVFLEFTEDSSVFHCWRIIIRCWWLKKVHCVLHSTCFGHGDCSDFGLEHLSCILVCEGPLLMFVLGVSL